MKKLTSFEEFFKDIRQDSFYIYGMSECAQTIYMYCLLHGKKNNIKCFLVSDLNSVLKKDKVLHKKKICEASILKGLENPIVILGAYKESTQKEIKHYIQEINFNAKIYCFREQYTREMLKKYTIQATEYIKKSHDISDSAYEYSFWNVTDKGSKQFYKYVLKLYAGSLPDTRIFGDGIRLDALHQQQIGNYLFIEDGKQDAPTAKFSIYMAKSHVDKALAEDCVSLHTIPLQVGAALTEQRICGLQDNVGDNLSLRNRDYCELSALYWAWKNDRESDYIGLCHYRRRFVLTEKQFSFIEEHDLDAVYTVPKIIDQGVEYEFIERCNHVKAEVWGFLNEAIYKIYPDYAEAWEQLKKADFLITLNMTIMKREVLHGYCKWLFRILEEVDRHYTEQGIQPNNRYLGYLGECLTTVYVIKNRDWLRTGYTEVQFLKPAE